MKRKVFDEWLSDEIKALKATGLSNRQISLRYDDVTETNVKNILAGYSPLKKGTKKEYKEFFRWSDYPEGIL